MVDGEQLKWCNTCYRYRVNPPETFSPEEKKEFGQVCSDCRWHWQCKDAREYQGESPLHWRKKDEA